MLVNIVVDDLSKAIVRYQRAAGFQIGRRFGSLGVEMLGASSPVYLLMKSAGVNQHGQMSCGAINDTGRRYIVASDLEPAVRQAMKAGSRMRLGHISGVRSRTWRILHGICFVEFQGRG